MKVFNGSHATGTWDDVAAPGNFFINTLSSSGSSTDTPPGGSATFNGTARKFTLSNPPLTAQQLLVSVNGVIQNLIAEPPQAKDLLLTVLTLYLPLPLLLVLRTLLSPLDPQ